MRGRTWRVLSRSTGGGAPELSVVRRGMSKHSTGQTAGQGAGATPTSATAGGVTAAEAGGQRHHHTHRGWTIGEGFRTAVGAALAGATAVVVEETLNDLVLWNMCKSHAMPVIDAHPRLQRSLPFRSEAWWNSSVIVKGRGNLVSCTFLLDGAKASCDVNVVLVRRPGSGKGAAAYVPNLFYNLASPGSYAVVRMDAVLPHEREAGLPSRVNLLQEAEPKGGVLENQGKKKGQGKKGGKGWFGWFRGKKKEEARDGPGSVSKP